LLNGDGGLDDVMLAGELGGFGEKFFGELFRGSRSIGKKSCASVEDNRFFRINYITFRILDYSKIIFKAYLHYYNYNPLPLFLILIVVLIDHYLLLKIHSL
jgi:hypothetical protein